MSARRKSSSNKVDGGFNLATALVLLVMLLVVVIALLTNMLYEEQRNLIKADEGKIYCIPVDSAQLTPAATLTPTPIITGADTDTAR